MAEEDAEFLTSKNKPLLFFENRLFRVVVGENDHKLNVYYLCNTNSRIKCNGRVIKLSVISGEIVQPCIDTCHQLSEEKILAIAAKERFFALVRAQPHRSNLECYNMLL
jgi:hypothetical protein